jgi:hypothetical protein
MVDAYACVEVVFRLFHWYSRLLVTLPVVSSSMTQGQEVKLFHPFILYSSSILPLFILYSSSIRPLFILWTFPPHPSCEGWAQQFPDIASSRAIGNISSMKSSSYSSFVCVWPGK